MKSVVVVGAQWGDEGKGKVVDYLSGSFDYIARVAGGHNAGHTVIIGKDRYVLQLIPCGILRPKQHAVIGTGVVVDPAALVAEIETMCKARSAQIKLARLLGELARPMKTRWRGVGCGCATCWSPSCFEGRQRTWWRRRTVWRKALTAQTLIFRMRWKKR